MSPGIIFKFQESPGTSQSAHFSFSFFTRSIMASRQVGFKRQRVAMSAKRPIDKQLKSINLAVSNSSASTTMYTATYPCTVTGLRWDVSAINKLTTGNIDVAWAVVILRDGYSANSLGLATGEFYTPEGDVLCYGRALLADIDASAGNINRHWEGHTKTMRKLQAGDILAVLTVGDTANCADLNGVIQYFLKG